MTYLLDRKNKRDKVLKISLGVIVLIIAIYFKANIFDGLSSFSHTIFRPVLVLGNNIGARLYNTSSFFDSKNTLLRANDNLRSDLEKSYATISNYNSILDENTKLKEIMGRKKEKNNIILSVILSKPSLSPYDTLIIDAGTNQGVYAGKTVFAIGDVPIGRIGEAYANSSKVILFSNPGEKTTIVIPGKDAFMDIVGRGGGNFEMVLPRDFILDKGTEVHLPGIIPYTVAVVQTIISDPRDAFQKALLSSPVNIQELKFVEVEQ